MKNRIEFHNAAQLAAAIERIPVPLDQVTVTGIDRNYLTVATLEEETLSDGSTVYNLILTATEAK